MNIYQKKTRWKYLLVLSGLIILAISTVYTNYLAKMLKEEEKTKVELWVIANKEIASTDTSCSLTLHERVMSSNIHIPALIVDEQDGIVAVRNFNCTDPKDPSLLIELEKIKATGLKPIPIITEYFTQYVYYKQSNLLQMLSFFPMIQVMLILAFIMIGYWLFSSARKSEQELVWVGMAKETAHQLGTPISAIIAWIDFLREGVDDPEEMNNILDELDTDVQKLETIADRFSKIGSKPDMEKQKLAPVLEAMIQYFNKRKPEGVQLSLDIDNLEIDASFNEHLLTWVIENLIRNSLDALDRGKGKIHLQVEDVVDRVFIYVTDTGHGIPGAKFKSVFQPGVSTKKRGWGLGLSLAKRIVENYHKGKIYVKSSKPNVETTIVIELRK